MSDVVEMILKEMERYHPRDEYAIWEVKSSSGSGSQNLGLFEGTLEDVVAKVVSSGGFIDYAGSYGDISKANIYKVSSEREEKIRELKDKYQEIESQIRSLEREACK